MTSKKYIACAVSVLCLFMIINLALWHGIVKQNFNQREINRMGSITTPQPIIEEKHYQRHHTELVDYLASGKIESFDVLTIGDSFSNTEYNYQDYIVDTYGLKILNARIQYTPLSDVYILLNLGIIDEIKPRVIIIESVERGVQDRFGSYEIVSNISSDITRERIILSKPNTTAASISSGIFAPILVKSSIKFLYDKVYHFLKPEQLSPEIYITKLDRNFFTNPGQENTLLHYFEDFNYLKKPLNAEMVNQNLNTAARLLKAKGITLIFFVAADKSDLYYPYILNKKGRSQNPFFQKMRDVQGKEYTYIDTLPILRQALERGEKDVYWLDDLHWSHKGIKIFCDELVKYILPELR